MEPKNTAVWQGNFVMMLIQIIGIALFVIFVWHCTLLNLVDYQLESNVHLQNLITQKKHEIAQIAERQQTISNYETRLRFIANLRAQNIKAARLMTELNNAKLPLIKLQRIQRQGDTVFISGVMPSNLALVQFMENLAHSTLFSQPVLMASPQKISHEQFNFALRVKMRT